MVGANFRAMLTWGAVLWACAGVACGDDEVGANTGGGADNVEVLTPPGIPLAGQTECRVVITTEIPVNSKNHVGACESVTYGTNPPSGGDHDSTWAAYKTYERPVRREHYVHNLEHGAVVLAHACDGECAGVVAALQEIVDQTTPDPLCIQAGGTVHARLLVTPDPKLATPIAAAAWGATYTATCLDPPSLRAFVDRAYARAPEDTCANGRDFDAEPLCP